MPSKTKGLGAAKRNYHKELEDILAQVKAKGEKPGLLVHACCGPCAAYVLEILKDHFQIHVFYDNPNIHGPEEYHRRQEALEDVLRQVDPHGHMTYTPTPYAPASFFRAIKGLEDLGERSPRCEACIGLRLDRAAAKARDLGMDFFVSTLSISPHKDANLINRLGQDLGEAYGVAHLPNDFKKKGGTQASTALCKAWGIYRQDYCGCVFSKAERERQSQEGGQNG